MVEDLCEAAFVLASLHKRRVALIVLIVLIRSRFIVFTAKKPMWTNTVVGLLREHCGIVADGMTVEGAHP